MMRCAVLEDEPIAREILERYISADSRLKLCGLYAHAPQALSALQKTPVDLIFLDIQLRKTTGFEFLASLSSPPLVVFTTAYREYAVDGFDLHAVDYLLKPFSASRFAEAVSKAAIRFEAAHPLSGTSRDADSIHTGSTPVRNFPREHATLRHGDALTQYLFIKAEGKFHKLSLKDILYIEAYQEYVKVVTPQRTFLTLQSMKAVEEKLGGAMFIRIHRSYLVSLIHIQSVESHTVCVGTVRLPVGKTYWESFLAKITSYQLL